MTEGKFHTRLRLLREANAQLSTEYKMPASPIVLKLLDAVFSNGNRSLEEAKQDFPKFDGLEHTDKKYLYMHGGVVDVAMVAEDCRKWFERWFGS